MGWYYSDNGQQKGPVDDAGFSQLVTAGVIRGDTSVWRDGMAGWQPFSQVQQSTRILSATASSAETGFCGECGRPFPRNELVAINSTQICGNCKPIYLQRLREGGAEAVGTLRYAGFWIRFAARLIDAILLQLVFLPFRLMLGLNAIGSITSPGVAPDAAIRLGLISIMLSLLSVVATAAYEIFMVGTRGATLGKMILGLKIVRANGAPVSWGLATGRYFATFVSAITLFVGYIMAGFDDQKRSLHDRICETRVIWTK